MVGGIEGRKKHECVCSFVYDNGYVVQAGTIWVELFRYPYYKTIHLKNITEGQLIVISYSHFDRWFKPLGVKK